MNNFNDTRRRQSKSSSSSCCCCCSFRGYKFLQNKVTIILVILMILTNNNNNSLFFLPTVVTAQDLPNPELQTEQFNMAAQFRQSFCFRQKMLHSNQVQLEHALEGMKIRSVIIPSQYIEVNETTGEINPEYPGLIGVLMDEIARRGRFSWRSSFAVTEGTPREGFTWTELLEWTTDAYDMSVDWWAHSISRLSLGINFPEGWHDGSIIMVGDVVEEEKSGFDLWTWLSPFDAGVWVMILASIVFSGLVYWVLETIDKKSDKRRLESNPIENVFLAGLTFTGQFDFSPRTHPARLFTVSLSFWAMIVGAAYTANMASFLVVKNQPKLQVNSIAEAVKQGLNICLYANTLADELVTKEFPNYKFIRKTLEKEIFMAVQTKECDVAIATVSAWQFYEGDIDVNPKCNLGWIGRTFRFVPAGFGMISDSGTLCTSLLRDVVNIILLRMKEDGFFEEAWDQYLQRSSTIGCRDIERGSDSGINSNDGDGEGQLKVENMGGIFIFHFALSCLAVLIAIVSKYFGWNEIPRFDKKGALSRKEIRRAARLEQAAGESSSVLTKDRTSFLRTSSKTAVMMDQDDSFHNRRDKLVKMATQKTFKEMALTSISRAKSGHGLLFSRSSSRHSSERERDNSDDAVGISSSKKQLKFHAQQQKQQANLASVSYINNDDDNTDSCGPIEKIDSSWNKVSKKKKRANNNSVQFQEAALPSSQVLAENSSEPVWKDEIMSSSSSEEDSDASMDYDKNKNNKNNTKKRSHRNHHNFTSGHYNGVHNDNTNRMLSSAPLTEGSSSSSSIRQLAMRQNEQFQTIAEMKEQLQAIPLMQNQIARMLVMLEASNNNNNNSNSNNNTNNSNNSNKNRW